MAYLARYPASRARLAQVLRRRVRREAAVHGFDPDEFSPTIEAVVGKLTELGVVDDGTFAAGRARALLRRGWRPLRVRQALRLDGVASEVVEAALAAALPPDHDPELAAAVRLARRRGLGPFRPAEERQRYRERDLRSLARQGFPRRLAVSLVDAPDPFALDDVLG